MEAAYRGARCRRDGSTHGPEDAAFTAAWIVTGLDPEWRWACQSLGVAAACCQPYRSKTTIGALLREATLAHHGKEQAAWIIRTLTRGNVRGPERLPDALDPWRGAYTRLTPLSNAALAA